MTKTLIKRVVVWMYLRGWISLLTAQKLFDRFTLGRH